LANGLLGIIFGENNTEEIINYFTMEFETTGMESAGITSQHLGYDEYQQAVSILHNENENNHSNSLSQHEEEHKKRKRSDDDEEEELSGEELASGGPIQEMNSDDKATYIKKQAIGWIQKNFRHNFQQNYTGISKDFVYQLYHHSFAATETPLMSVPQFTRLFNEVMYKDMDFNPRARKTPTNQVIGELFPLLGVTLEIVEKTFGHKDKRITFFPRICLADHIKELKDTLVTGSWNQQSFLESLRSYKRLCSEGKERKIPKRQSLDLNNLNSSMGRDINADHRIYSNDKYLVVALDIPGVDPNEIEISFPTDRSIRVAHKEGTKTYEETVLLESGQFSLIGGSLRRGNILSSTREIQLSESIEVPHPSNTSTPFIHDHYGTVLFKFVRKFQQEETYLKSYWSKEPLKFE